MHGWNRSRVAASFFHPPPMKNKGLEGKKKKAKTRQCLSPPPLCEPSAFPKPVPVSRAKLQFGNYGFVFLPAEKQQHEVPDSSHWNLGRPESGIGLPNVFSARGVFSIWQFSLDIFPKDVFGHSQPNNSLHEEIIWI